MKTHLKYARALASFLVLAAGSAQADVLSAQEIVSMHSGECITYWGPMRGTQCFEANGSINYDDQSWGRDTGVW